MTTPKQGLFSALYTNMNYLSQRQKVIATNIANADTPDYQAQDITNKPDFKAILGNASRSGTSVSTPSLGVTNESHMTAGGAKAGASATRTADQRNTYEVSPVGNSVVIEEQLLQSNAVVGEYNMMANIHEKYLNMVRTAIGNNR